MSVESRLKNIVNRFNKEHRSLMEEFIDNKRANHIEMIPLISKLQLLRKILNEIDIPLKEMIEEDNKAKAKQITNKIFFSEELTFSHRRNYKMFFRWLNEGETPAFLKTFSTRKTFRELKPKRKSLTHEEIRSIIDNTETQRDRTIFTMMAEIPMRPIEICRIKMKHVSCDEYGYIIELRGKTQEGHRRIRYIHSTPEIKAHSSALPESHKNDKEKAFFYSYSDRNKGESITPVALHYVLMGAVKRAGLRKDIQLYDFRRYTATSLLADSNYTITDVQKLGGWKSLQVVNVYNKTTDDQVNEKRLVVNGLGNKELMLQGNILKNIECPRCKTVNQKSADLCVSCWQPLTATAINKTNSTMNNIFKKESFRNYIKKELIDDIKKELKEELGLKVEVKN